MSAKALAVFLFACVALASAQVITLGGCPKSIQPMGNFKAPEFLKTWYVQKSYFFIFEFGGKCTTAEYSLNDDGSIKVANRQINKFTGKTQNIEGNAVFAKNNTVGDLRVTFPSGPVSVPAPYWVVDTDYDSYALVYSCYDFKVAHSANSYLMTRERKPSKEVMEKALAAAKAKGIDTKPFLTNDQEKCDN